MTNRRGRPVTFDHRHNSHASIAMTPERAAELSRVAALLGVSRHVLLQRFISLGLSVFDENS